LAATIAEPQAIWGSKNGEYEDFTIGTDADDAWGYTLASDQVNVIRWLCPARYLFPGTHGGEWIMSSGSDDSPITPTQVKVRRETTHGSSTVQGIQIGHGVFFVTRSGRKVRQITYRLTDDSFSAEEISILAQHLMRHSGIVDWTHQSEPDSILWCVRADGALLGFTTVREHKVFAWHYHDTDAGNDLFEAVASIPESDHDQVWFVVQRYIDGSWVRYVEYLEKDFGLYQKDAVFVDSALTFYNPATITDITQADPGVVTSVGHGLSDGDKIYISDVGGMTEVNDTKFLINNSDYDSFELQDEDGNDVDTSGYTAYSSGGTAEEVATVLSGLDHLEGESVDILADGAVRAAKTVSSGAITLDRECIKAQIGLGYTSILEPMRLESGILGTTAQGRTKRVHEAVIRFFETIGAEIGSDTGDVETIPFRKAADPMDTAVTPFTGDKQITFPGGYDMDGYIRIEQSLPTPMTVLAIIAKLNVYGD
jgi:hypothetical protein